MRPAALLIVLVACSDDAAAPPERIVALDAAPRIDAAVEQAIEDEPAVEPQDRPAPRERRVLQINLSSTPSGATVLVDGSAVGTTPTYWEGEFTGCVREFRFEKTGHTTKRYRFVPIQNGHVHGRLDRLTEQGDVGVPVVIEPLAPCHPPAPASSGRRKRPAPPPPPPPAIDAGVPAIDAGAPRD